MKITKIEKQKKDKQRYNIFLDGQFAFGLYEDSVLKYGLRSDDELSEEKIKEIKEYDEFAFGKRTAYFYLAYKQRSKDEIVKKLKQKKISAKIIADIIELLEKQKYLNDNIYAKNYLEDKLSKKPIGKRLARLKLMEKGIDKETSEKIILENYTDEKEVEMAKKVLKDYEKKVRYKNDNEKKNKCYRYLISRGFDYEIASEALNR